MPRRPAAARLLTLAVPLLVALSACGEPLSPQMPVREVLGSLVDGPWELFRAHPDAPPRAGLICPSTDWRVDGGELPALVLPPPAELRLVVPERLGALDAPGADRAPALQLDVRAGFDRRVRAKTHGDLTGVRAVVELLSAERTLLRAEFALDDDGQRRWIAPDGGAPTVRPGETLTARTRLLDADGRPVTLDAPVDVGLGGLTLVRRSTRWRVPSAPTRPNVVLLVLDTVRADRTSLLGYERPTTPHLSRLAARGLLHAGALTASSWTWPSTASLLTGLHPQEHGVVDGGACFLDDALVSLPERMQQLGFSTAAWSGNPLIGPSRNFHQGFERFEAARGRMRPSDEIMPEVLDWLDDVAGTRFFLYLQLMDAHSPLRPRPQDRARFAAGVPDDFDIDLLTKARWRLLDGEGFAADGTQHLDEVITAEQRAQLSELYDASVASADARVGALLDALDAHGLTDETLVVVTTDHGEELFDHGLAGHGHSLHPELVDSFVVFAGPQVPAGVRVDVPVSNRHLAYTLLYLLGDEPGAFPVRDALDLLGPADGFTGRAVILSTRTGWWNGRHPQPLLGMTTPWGMLHRAPEGGPWGGEPDPDGQWRFEPSSRDAMHPEPLDAEQEQLQEALRQRLAGTAERQVRLLDAWAAERAASSPSRTRAAGDRTLEMLRELGYVAGDPAETDR